MNRRVDGQTDRWNSKATSEIVIYTINVYENQLLISQKNEVELLHLKYLEY